MRRTPDHVERAVIDALKAGHTTAAVAAQFGLASRTVDGISRRRGLSRRGWRPQVTTALTADQQALVEAHQDFVQRIARACCRDKSAFPSCDEDEYISVAYLALVGAASRWQRRSSFKTFLRKCVTGAIADWRRADMLAHGWAWENHRAKRLMQVAQITAWPKALQ